MAVTKRDTSGIFSANLTGKRSPKTTGSVISLQLNHNGITFISNHTFPKWTELDVRMHLPQNGQHKASSVTCCGIIVQCAKRSLADGYTVSLLFLDLPKHAHPQVDLNTSQTASASIWISR